MLRFLLHVQFLYTCKRKRWGEGRKNRGKEEERVESESEYWGNGEGKGLFSACCTISAKFASLVIKLAQSN